MRRGEGEEEEEEKEEEEEEESMGEERRSERGRHTSSCSPSSVVPEWRISIFQNSSGTNAAMRSARCATNHIVGNWHGPYLR